jgi:hypothetical protein
MSEPKRETRYPKLAPLKERLMKIHQRGAHEKTVESSLADMVSHLEEAAYQVAHQTFMGENFDNYEDLRNLAKVEKELHAVAEKLEGALACRNSYFRY